MKQYGAWVLVLAAAITLLSCGKPAILFLDPASEAYYAWQGFDRAQLESAAGRADFKLRIWPIDPKISVATQVEAAWKQAGSPQTVLIYPPILVGQAKNSQQFLRAKASLVLGSGQGLDTFDSQKIQFPEIDRTPAFVELGALTALWLDRDGQRKARCLFVTQTPQRKKDLESLWKGFSGQAGPIDRFQVQQWDLPPSVDELRSITEQLKLESDTLLLVFLDNGSADFCQGLPEWPGHIASEQLGQMGEKMGNIVASVNISWGNVLQKMLEKTNIQVNKSSLKPNSLVELHLYTEYIKK